MNKPNTFLMDFYQIRALVMKSMTLQFRQYLTNLFQLLAPVACVLFVFTLQVVANILVNSTVPEDQREFKMTPPPTSVPLLYQMSRQNVPGRYFSLVGEGVNRDALGYIRMNGERSGLLGQFAMQVNRTIVNSTFWEMIPYFEEVSSQDDVNSYYLNNMREQIRNQSGGSFTFKNLNYSLTSDAILEYMLQYDNTSQTRFCSFVSNAMRVNACQHVIASGLMSFLHNAYIQVLTSGAFMIQTIMRQMPFTQTIPVINVADFVGIFIFPVVLLLPLPVFCYSIVLEKSNKLREMMRLMGMRMRNYVIVTYSFNLGLCLLSILLFVIFAIIFGFRFITGTHPVITILALIGWSFNLVSFSFLLSAFVGNSLIAVVFGYMIVLFGPIAGVIMETQVFDESPYWSFLLLVFPFPLTRYVTSSSRACSRLICHELSALWNTHEVYLSIIAFFFNAVIYLIAALYFDQILPQPWGIRKKPWFCFEWIWKGMKCCKSKVQDYKSSQDSSDAELDDDVKQEKRKIIDEKTDPEECGILLYNLRKTYGKKKAVNGTYMSIKKNECFGLLGSNGAGKTTTISMLCGLFSPSSGTAFVNGYDIRTDMEMIYRTMGLCPQFDIIFDSLTPYEHLLFYARMKGVPISEEKKHAMDLLNRVGLSPKQLKRSPLAGSLSGGMKRRLSIAMSFVGDPAVVMLDEPTTGLDASTKRFLWEMIREKKEGRCIVLTTHSLEEADILCDRIGIMALGQFACLGTSLHLKNKFGKGFHVNVNFDESQRDKAKKCVPSLLPAAKLKVEFAGNLIYEVMRSDVKVSKLFREMEQCKEQFGVRDWGISQTTLEDVFLNIVKYENPTKSDEEVAGQEIQNSPKEVVQENLQANPNTSSQDETKDEEPQVQDMEQP